MLYVAPSSEGSGRSFCGWSTLDVSLNAALDVWFYVPPYWYYVIQFCCESVTWHSVLVPLRGFLGFLLITFTDLIHLLDYWGDLWGS